MSIRFAFGLALVVAFAFAMAQAQPAKARGNSTGFSTPCEPVAPAYKATSESKVVSTVDSVFALENTAAATGVARAFRVSVVSLPVPPEAPADYPPLLHRPPPSSSDPTL